MTQTFTPAANRAPEKKVYYVIKSTVGWYFTEAGRETQATRPQDALQFDSVQRALSAYREAYRKSPNSSNIPYAAQLVRVEETPGIRTLRLASTRVIDAAKPVVLFNAERQEYGIWRGPSIGMQSARSIQGATVFPDVGEALEALTIDAADLGKFYTHETTHLHQVEYVTAEPAVTETVIQ